jgi:hypothetical protein
MPPGDYYALSAGSVTPWCSAPTTCCGRFVVIEASLGVAVPKIIALTALAADLFVQVTPQR